jgi:hypothetical protein
MSQAIEVLQAAQQRAMAGRPKVGGFPYLAETLRQAGVTKNTWTLPACQGLFLTREGPVVMQGTPLVTGAAAVPAFDREALTSTSRLAPSPTSGVPERNTWRATPPRPCHETSSPGRRRIPPRSPRGRPAHFRQA